MRSALCLLTVSGALMFGGCASYVNIPPQVGDLALHSPNHPTVALVEAEAIRGLVLEQPPDLPYQVSLPPKTSSSSYETVLKHLGENAQWPEEGPQAGVPVLEVRQLRLRGWYAQVDVLRPSSFNQPDGPTQLTTVWLKWYPFAGWRFQRAHVWSLGVDEALSESRRLAEYSE